MSIINRYLIKEILKHFWIVLVAAVSIYVIVDFFERIDDFVEAGLPVTRIITFLQLKLPLITAQILPVGILLAILITFGLMKKNNEIIALKNGGMSVYYFLKPVFSLGVLFTFFLFFLSEIIVPLTISKSNEIWRLEVKKKKYAITSAQKDIWIKGHRSISYISYFNPQDLTISGIALNFFDQQFRLARRVDAAKGEFKQGHWVFYNTMEQVLNQKTGSYVVKFQNEQVEEIDFLPEDLQRAVKKSEEMSFNELYDYIQDIEAEGYDATSYWVDFHGKFALPVTCLIVSLIATGIALRERARAGLPLSIAFGMVMVFFYWISQSFCLSLGYGGVLPPVIAAWISNFIFACFAVFQIFNAE